MCVACCIPVPAARRPQPAERRHFDMHGDRPLHVHAAPSALSQARQQKGKAPAIPSSIVPSKLGVHQITSFNNTETPRF
jgi:hypothetical protein